MNIFQPISLLCISLLFYACNSNTTKSATAKKKANDGLYRISIALPDMDTLQDIYLSEVADSVFYTALSDGTPLPNGLRAEITDSGILVSSIRQGSENLELYDFNGDLKKDIGARGRGVGEYLDPAWGVNRNTNEAYVSSRASYAIQTYDLLGSSPKMIKKVKNNRLFQNPLANIMGVGKNILTIYSSRYRYNKNQIELMLYNPRTNTIVDSLINYNTLPEHSKRTGMVMHRSPSPMYVEYKNEIYYMNVYSDTLYRITEKEIMPFAIFEFGKYKYHAENPIAVEKFQEAKMPVIKSIFLSSILRTSNGLYAQFRYKENRFLYALNLDNLAERYCKPYFINDLDNGPDYNIHKEGQPNIDQSPHQMIDVATFKLRIDDAEKDSRRQNASFPKERLFTNNKMAKKLKNIANFQQLWDKSTEESNPIVQIFNFKE